MTVGLEIKNEDGRVIIASYMANYRYRGKVSTSVVNESGSTGSERMILSLYGAVAPLIFIGGNTKPVCITGQGTSGAFIECADGDTASFTAYIFDVTTNTAAITAETHNSHGGDISNTQSWYNAIGDNYGLQVFDEGGDKVFDAVNWQCPVKDAFTLTSTLVSSHIYAFNGAAIDIAYGHNLVDTGGALYQINRAMIKWTGKTLATSSSNPGWATLVPIGTPAFRQPLIAVINVDDLPA